MRNRISMGDGFEHELYAAAFTANVRNSGYVLRITRYVRPIAANVRNSGYELRITRYVRPIAANARKSGLRVTHYSLRPANRRQRP
ncbi:MAG TPA: hypothetical protein PK170_09385, partial [Anaerolineae bacterium]|nr:hypothetical protein [Anaerolineae bacterium]